MESFLTSWPLGRRWGMDSQFQQWCAQNKLRKAIEIKIFSFLVLLAVTQWPWLLQAVFWMWWKMKNFRKMLKPQATTLEKRYKSFVKNTVLLEMFGALGSFKESTLLKTNNLEFKMEKLRNKSSPWWDKEISLSVEMGSMRMFWNLNLQWFSTSKMLIIWQKIWRKFSK